MTRRRLAQRLITAIILASSAITLAITCVQLYLEYTRDTAAIHNHLDQIEQTYLASVSQNVWLADRTRLALLLQGICSLPDVTHAEVVADGGWTVHAGLPGPGLVRRYPLTMDYRGSAQAIGTLMVTASMDDVVRRLIERAGFILLANGLKTALVAIVIYLLVEQLITRRLAAIADQSRRIGDGDLTTPISLAEGEPDEILALASALEKMRCAVLDSAQHLRRKNQELEEFAWVLAHHLQEPVRQQCMFAQRLDALVGSTASADMQDALNFVQQGALRQRALLVDVQRYLSLDQTPSSDTVCDTAACIDRAVLRLGGLIHSTGAKITSGAMPPVWMDADRLTTVFTALIENAVIHSHPQTPPLVSVTADKADGMACLSVADNGPGIPLQYHDKAFCVFERLNPNDGRASTGIGLALVRKIVESAGGRVWLDAKSVPGTRVCFTLPLPMPLHPRESG